MNAEHIEGVVSISPDELEMALAGKGFTLTHPDTQGAIQTRLDPDGKRLYLECVERGYLTVAAARHVADNWTGSAALAWALRCCAFRCASVRPRASRAHDTAPRAVEIDMTPVRGWLHWSGAGLARLEALFEAEAAKPYRADFGRLTFCASFPMARLHDVLAAAAAIAGDQASSVCLPPAARAAKAARQEVGVA